MRLDNTSFDKMKRKSNRNENQNSCQQINCWSYLDIINLYFYYQLIKQVDTGAITLSEISFKICKTWNQIFFQNNKKKPKDLQDKTIRILDNQNIFTLAELYKDCNKGVKDNKEVKDIQFMTPLTKVHVNQVVKNVQPQKGQHQNLQQFINKQDFSIKAISDCRIKFTQFILLVSPSSRYYQVQQFIKEQSQNQNYIIQGRIKQLFCLLFEKTILKGTPIQLTQFRNELDTFLYKQYICNQNQNTQSYYSIELILIEIYLWKRSRKRLLNTQRSQLQNKSNDKTIRLFIENIQDLKSINYGTIQQELKQIKVNDYNNDCYIWYISLRSINEFYQINTRWPIQNKSIVQSKSFIYLHFIIIKHS
ncbi:unnamed protein product [Paramecium sonneborni]|uniref:Uncharacterized protein n=1 Tax=Paramecium sonneborni TaxID=65129 RepID=A0A8S1RQA5_9CILI|nr:unnamed protein product [Paramecium sonneborni]